MMGPRALPCALLSVALAGVRTTGAQEWRTLTASRQARDSAPVKATVVYGVGSMRVGAASPPFLYRMSFRYDRGQTRPIHAFDSAKRTLRLGIQSQTLTSGRQNRGGDLTLDLSPTTPMDLNFEVGAAEATLELGGLSLTDLSLKSGATDVTIRFGSPNRVQMRTLSIKTGAARVSAEGLANANARLVSVQAGAGDVELDFGGSWTRDVALNVHTALGGVTVRVPPDVGVRLRVRKFVGEFDESGLVRRGDDYVTPNFDAAPHKLSVQAHTVFGSFELDRTGGGHTGG